MLVIDETCQDHFRDTMEFAAKHPERLTSLLDNLKYLSDYGTRRSDVRSARTVLTKDFAPYSFNFYTFWNDEDRPMMVGGLIFHGPHDGGGDGSAPTFSVNLVPVKAEHGEWRTHT